MNLKEAFRFQNKIQVLMTEAQSILSKEKNITRVEKTTLQSKVVPGAEDVVVVEVPETEFVDNITDIAALLMFLLNEREKLSLRRAGGQKIVAINVGCMMPYMDYEPRTLKEILEGVGTDV